MPSYPTQANPGMFLPTTNVWNIEQLADLPIDPTLKELLILLYQHINTLSLAINLKDTGYYTLEEFLNSQAWFPDPALSSTTPLLPDFRQVFRKVINFGQLPNATSDAVAHTIPITSGYTFTRIYGTANDTTGNSYIPLPYASPTDSENIELEVDLTDVIITTGSDRTNYDTTYVVLEYIKS